MQLCLLCQSQPDHPQIGSPVCRLVDELEKALHQETASTEPSTSPSKAPFTVTAAAARAAVPQDDGSAVLYAASRLACFCPLSCLLNLTQAALERSQCQVEANEQLGQIGFDRLSLDLAEALISAWLGQESRGALLDKTAPRVSREGEEGQDQGSRAAWGSIFKGLLQRALSHGDAARSSADTHVDVLLLRMLQCSQPAFWDRLVCLPCRCARVSGSVAFGLPLRYRVICSDA